MKARGPGAARSGPEAQRAGARERGSGGVSAMPRCVALVLCGRVRGPWCSCRSSDRERPMRVA
eukprot:7633258-Heterocapsa_arctica.AAC.1